MKFKIKNSLFFILIALFMACSDESANIPANILSKEEMAAVLTDIHILEAAMSLNISSAIQTGNDNREETTLAILKKHNVTKEQYDETFRFYGEHLDLLGDIYKLVLNNLSELQAKTANEKDTVKTDSIPKDSVKVKLKKMVQQQKLKEVRPKP
ncbi:MAG TPA: DUF4296 domain-containing protein [Bacteroidia bacterium]|jgi:hypothetical protein|nr:DUF4296 domain-containing protein [Bacteroidia bacterium]